jgi:AcrR family transcriptional regulator
VSKSPAGPAGPAPATAVLPARGAGRPRSAEVDLSILAAATAILDERGLAGMSMEEVASRAGVGKATVYRRWPSRGALALDAFMAEFRSQLQVPDTGTLRGDLLASLRAWSRAVSKTRAGRMLAGLLAEAQRDPQLAVAWRERVFDPLRAQQKTLVDKAVRRGEIPAGTDADVVLDLVFGAAYHRLLQGHLPLSDRFARQVVDLVMDGVAPARAPG